jgi:AcrR family transcriptional regulator
MTLATKPKAPNRKATKTAANDLTETAVDQAREEILLAAAAAFMEIGYAATSIDTVADFLGATKGRIYYYYKTKADLFFDVYRMAMELNIRTIRKVATQDVSARERLYQMVIEHANLVMDHFALQRVSVQGIEMHLRGSTTPSQRKMLSNLVDMRDEYERYFINVLSDGVEAKEFRNLVPSRVVKPLLGALNWMTIWYKPSSAETAKSKRKIAEDHAEFVIQSVLRKA